MSEAVPILRVGPDLLVTLQGDLDDRTVESIEREVTAEVTRTHAQGVLIDVSGLAVVDSFVARVLARLVDMVRLLGADSTLVGIGPSVAITLTELGASLDHVPTALTAEQGMSMLHRLRSPEPRTVVRHDSNR
jgi:rsbT antagonist protein RsbS